MSSFDVKKPSLSLNIPWSWYLTAISYTLASLTVIAPPSPVVIVLFSCKLKQPISPNEPEYLPLYLLPHDWATSSITFRLYFFATAIILSILHGFPKIGTTITAFVCLSITLSISSGSIFILSSTSANIGTAPAAITAPTDAKNVTAGTITLSPEPIPNALSATISADVPEVTPSAYSHPIFEANLLSKLFTVPTISGP